ncbi:hypothetical protein PR202_gb11739 [Eleusine coracana subsp. coracana]|uniref:Pectinesterase n=1 Tax=Eleusine coracana subsp. coracana TaxID=191504 RepID=A0AAV5EMG9_ELECO|nr:hypothetical protein PR202_gb11739 [Eleusine coracana subsp. coracana]
MWVTSPAWAEKMLLQDTEAQADAVVAQDGTGDFTTISAAIAAAPQRSLKRHTIHVKRGVYDEIVRISKTTLNLKLVGDGMDVTVITGNSSVDLYTMQETATIGVDGPGFMAQDMTIQNTAVDFIYGDAIAVFQKCLLMARTAERHGVETYLGRPWKPYSRTVFMECFMDNIIHPLGYLPWDGSTGLHTLFYGEYNNTGGGSNTTGRVKWTGFHIIGAYEAHKFTVTSFIDGGSWLPETGVEFAPGL